MYGVALGDLQRFIPAPAGNGKGHRICHHFQDGSSPRLRGTGPLGVGAPGFTRFIPAPAGNGHHQRPS